MTHIYRSPENETRTLDSGIIVERYRMLGTHIVKYRAYEPTDKLLSSKHHTMTTIDGAWCGTLASRRDDSTFAHLRAGSDERIAAVDAAYKANADAAYAAIIAAFPEAADGRRDMGDIEIRY